MAASTGTLLEGGAEGLAKAMKGGVEDQEVVQEVVVDPGWRHFTRI